VARATRSRPAAGSEACAQSDASLVRAFELLGRRWTGVILGTLSDRPASFRELARAVPGISDSMLSTRLTALTKAGLLTRAVDEGPPLSVAYQLTDAGCALLPALDQISRWADEHLPPAGFEGKALRPASA
jgi:DNA-binding HxlR family transcriptional regulator